MGARPRKQQQPRNRRVSIAVSDEVLRMWKAVARTRKTPYTRLLDTMSLNAIVAEYRRMEREFNGDSGKAPDRRRPAPVTPTEAAA